MRIIIPAEVSSQGGVGIKAAQLLVDNKVDTLRDCKLLLLGEIHESWREII